MRFEWLTHKRNEWTWIQNWLILPAKERENGDWISRRDFAEEKHLLIPGVKFLS